MIVKIQVTITKKTAKKSDYAEFISDFSGKYREGEGYYDYLDFGPFNLSHADIEKLQELLDFLRGPVVRGIYFIDVRNGGTKIETNEE